MTNTDVAIYDFSTALSALPFDTPHRHEIFMLALESLVCLAKHEHQFHLIQASAESNRHGSTSLKQA